MANLSNINNKFIVTDGGHVSIGATTTTYPLTVESGGIGTVLRAGTAFVSIDSVGTAASPSLIFNGDSNTGIWRAASDTLAFSTAGTERMRVWSGGMIQIGGDVTATPELLTLQAYTRNEAFSGKYSASGYLWFLRNETGPSGRFQLYNAGSTTINLEGNTTRDNYILGDLGIGNTSPTAKLTIDNSISTAYSTTSYAGTPAFSMVYLNNTHGGSNTASLINFRAGSGDGVLGFVEGGGTNDADFIIQTDGGINGIERFRILNNGNVGIGTTEPPAALTVAHDLSNGGDATGFRLNAASDQSSNTLFGGPVSSGDYAFFQSYKEGVSAGVRNLSLQPIGGNVGIGDPDPAYRLSVTGSLDERVQINSTANKTAGIYMRVISGGTLVGTGTIATQNDGNMKFFTGTSGEAVAMTLDTDGRLQDTAGIYLGSNNNNQLLNYYKEDTWTPQIYYQNGTDQLASQNTTQTGLYTKIGNTVLVQFRLIWTITGTPAVDNIGIKNLPWQGHATNAFAEIPCFIKNYTGGPSPRGNLTLTLPTANQTLALFNDTNFIGNMGNAIGTGTHEIRFSFTYLTN